MRHVKQATWAAHVVGFGLDSGYLTDTVWRQAEVMQRAFPRARVFVVKGMGGPGRQVITKPGRSADRKKKHPWLVGTDTAKDALLSHGLRVPVPPGGPGAVRFSDALDPAFYQQLTAETPTRVQHGGRTAIVWRKLDASAANEALDLLVYNLAVAVAMTTHFHTDFAALAARRIAPPVPVQAVPAPRPANTTTWLPPRRGWL